MKRDPYSTQRQTVDSWMVSQILLKLEEQDKLELKNMIEGLIEMKCVLQVIKYRYTSSDGL